MTLLLNPYFWAAQVLALAIAVFGGCQWQGNREEQTRANLNNEIAVLENDVGLLSVTLNDVNAVADRAKRDAAAQAVYAVEAVRQADKDRAKYEAALGSVEDALERAKRTPTCRAQLEAESCADFH